MTTDFDDEDEVMTKKIEWNGKILPDHHIEHAFTCGDTPYFHFTDSFSIPCERAMDALHIYQEFKNRTDDVFLQAHCTAKQNLYLKNPISIFELKKLDDQLQERLSMALPPPRIIENLASVVYFDSTENPYKYDRAYAEKKIKKWKEGKITDVEGVEKPYDFFLLMPLGKLLPSLDSQEQDLVNYSQIASLMDQQHLKTIFNALSLNQRNFPTYKQLFSSNIMAKKE